MRHQKEGNKRKNMKKMGKSVYMRERRDEITFKLYNRAFPF